MLAGWTPASAGAARLAQFFQLLFDFSCRPVWDFWNQLVEDPQCAEALLLAKLANAFVKILDRFADHGALGFAEPFGGIAQAAKGEVIQREGDFAGCHTDTILPYTLLSLDF